MKKFFKYSSIVGLFILVLVAGLIFFTSDLTDTADQFFLAAQEGDLDKAYSLVSEDFKTSVSRTELEAFLKQNRLADYKEANWLNRSINGNRGELQGSIVTNSGGVVPITIGLVKGDSEWKIFSIAKPNAGLQIEAGPDVMPSEAELMALSKESMRLFANTIHRMKSDRFYEQISERWRSQTTSEEIDEGFADLYDFAPDLRYLNDVTPALSPSLGIDGGDELQIVSKYPTEPTRITFTQRYVYEGLGWKLSGIGFLGE